jgi:hypothetical protein
MRKETTMSYTPAEWADVHLRSAHAEVAAARNKMLAFAAEPNRNWAEAVRLGNALAVAYGKVEAAELCERLAIGMSNGLELTEALLAINENVGSVARNDGWSGNGNDGKRSYRDGYLEVTGRFAAEIVRSAKVTA